MDYYIVELRPSDIYTIICEKCNKQSPAGKKEKLTNAQKAGLDVQCDSCGEDS